jgi:hypothetical protein
VAEEVEHLASKYEALGSIPTTTQVKKKKENYFPLVLTKPFTFSFYRTLQKSDLYSEYRSLISSVPSSVESILTKLLLYHSNKSVLTRPSVTYHGTQPNCLSTLILLGLSALDKVGNSLLL